MVLAITDVILSAAKEMAASKPVVLSAITTRHMLCLLVCAVIALGPGRAGAADPSSTLSVGIFSGQRILACAITSQGALSLQDETGRRLADLPPGAVLRVEARDGEVAISSSAPLGRGQGEQYLVCATAPIQVSPERGKSRAYRGRIAVSARRGGLALTNQVELEDYLRGVLPSEIPARFAPEALRAQAIAARTYAVVTSGRHLAEAYDLCDASHCQVYLGVTGEDARTDAAVRDTAGLIVTYQGRPIHAVYHDSCGGRTAGNESVWPAGGPLPYLRPVADGDRHAPWCGASPHVAWTRQVPQARLAAALAQFGVAAPISSIEAGACDENRRPTEFHLRGPWGEATIPAGTLRTAVNAALGWNTLLSADFAAAPNGDSIVFAGRGSGHGVGLCQWGASAMAQGGHTAAEILAHYYSGTRVEPMSAEITRRLDRPATG